MRSRRIDYYRKVWVKRYYIEKVFKGLFEIVDFIGSFHFYQDLVVVRRYQDLVVVRRL
jgi:hypothetical protein